MREEVANGTVWLMFAACLFAGVVSIGLVAWYVDGLSKPKNGVLLRDKAVFITGCDTGMASFIFLYRLVNVKCLLCV